MKTAPRMRLIYLHPNVSFCFCFGDAPTRLEGEPLFFKNKPEAVDAAKRKGLAVVKSGWVMTTETVDTLCGRMS